MRTILIADESVLKLYPQRFDNIIAVPAGEGAKTLEVAHHCWSELERMRADRKSTIVALGGGATCDLAGFVAATYMRGIRLILKPSTLLAMIDASVGGKCGINLNGHKNFIGVIREPDEVQIEIRLLETGDQRGGMAEAIKIAAIADAELFASLEEGIDLRELIERCIALKKRIVAEGRRDLLNFGHTYAHAIELECGLSHGEAVAIGMCAAARLTGVEERIIALCKKYDLPTEMPQVDHLEERMRRDKKSVEGDLTLILCPEIGRGEISVKKGEIAIH